MHGHNRSFAEIVDSSLEQCSAQTWQWNDIPAFGSLVTILSDDLVLLGLVHDINIGSRDPARTPFIYQKTPEELLRDQPQIFTFLKTTFSCIIVGYIHRGATIYALAPRPAYIHSFVQLAAPEIATQFFSAPAYTHCLFGVHSHITRMDELLLALLRQYHPLLSHDSLQTCMHAYMTLVGNDYQRIRLFARRVSALHIS